MNNEKPTALLNELMKVIRTRINETSPEGAVQVPNGDLVEVSKKIEQYVYTMGRRNKLIPKNTKKEELTFDQVYTVLSEMMTLETSNKFNNKRFWEIMKPFVQNTVFRKDPNEEIKSGKN